MPISTSTAVRHVKGAGGRAYPCGEWSFFPRRDGSATSNPFEVHQEPVVIIGACLVAGHIVQVQVSPDEGLNWQDLYLHGMPVQLTSENSLQYLSVAGKYRLVYSGTPIGRVSVRRNTLTHDPMLPMVPEFIGTSVYLKKADDTAENLTLYKPGFQAGLIINADADANEPFPGEGLGGIGFRMDDELKFRLSYSLDAWGLHAYDDDGDKFDVFTAHRQTQSMMFYGSINLIGDGPPTPFRGVANIDAFKSDSMVMMLQETTGGATVKSSAVRYPLESLSRAHIDFLTQTAGGLAAGAGPEASIRQADEAGVLQNRLVFQPEGYLNVGGALVDTVIDLTGGTNLTLDFRKAGVYKVDAGAAIDVITSKAGQAMQIVVVGSGAVTFTASVDYGVTLATGATWGTTYTTVQLFDTGGSPRVILAGTTPF